MRIYANYKEQHGKDYTIVIDKMGDWHGLIQRWKDGDRFRWEGSSNKYECEFFWDEVAEDEVALILKDDNDVEIERNKK